MRDKTAGRPVFSSRNCASSCHPSNTACDRGRPLLTGGISSGACDNKAATSSRESPVFVAMRVILGSALAAPRCACSCATRTWANRASARASPAPTLASSHKRARAFRTCSDTAVTAVFSGSLTGCILSKFGVLHHDVSKSIRPFRQSLGPVNGLLCTGSHDHCSQMHCKFIYSACLFGWTSAEVGSDRS